MLWAKQSDACFRERAVRSDTHLKYFGIPGNEAANGGKNHQPSESGEIWLLDTI